VHYILEIIFIVIGAYSIFMGISKYGFWSGTVPGGGFMPVLMGGLLILFSVLTFLSKKNRIKFNINKKGLLPVLGIIGALLIHLVIGLIPAVAVMIFGWLKFIEKYSIKSSMIVTALTTAIAYAIFGLWLRVPFPMGMINL
jgi:polyferredoxin